MSEPALLSVGKPMSTGEWEAKVNEMYYSQLHGKNHQTGKRGSRAAPRSRFRSASKLKKIPTTALKKDLYLASVALPMLSLPGYGRTNAERTGETGQFGRLWPGSDADSKNPIIDEIGRAHV